MYRQPVVIGRDTGTLAEIVSGLDPDAQVVVQPDVSMADGTPVEVESAAVAEAPEDARPAAFLTGGPARVGADGMQFRARSCRREGYDGPAFAPPRIRDQGGSLMSTKPRRSRRPRLESLEARLAMSLPPSARHLRPDPSRQYDRHQPG